MARHKKTVPAPKKPALEGTLQFDTGSLTKNQLDAILNKVPIDITFIDAEDTVRYFNMPENRTFVRPKAVLGRKVQNCHPQKSLHAVNKIVESFKNGEKAVAEFWLTLHDRFVYIRFFPVQDADGKYYGAIEVVQDVTDIKKLEGERRLLD